MAPISNLLAIHDPHTTWLHQLCCLANFEFWLASQWVSLWYPTMNPWVKACTRKSTSSSSYPWNTSARSLGHREVGIGHTNEVLLWSSSPDILSLLRLCSIAVHENRVVVLFTHKTLMTVGAFSLELTFSTMCVVGETKRPRNCLYLCLSHCCCCTTTASWTPSPTLLVVLLYHLILLQLTVFIIQ